MKPYYAVLIPYTEDKNEFTPTSPTGPFSTLMHGSFKTPHEAHEWASAHILGRRYGIVRVQPLADGTTQTVIGWEGVATQSDDA